ncbi:MAG: endolytic transglycosylase MltG [Sphingomicrobium sp.]
MRSRARLARRALAAVAALAAVIAGWSWWGASAVEKDAVFDVPTGASLTTVASKLARDGDVGSARSFLAMAKVFGSHDPIQAGEFMLPKGASAARILDILQHGQAIRRFITIPEGLPSILVYERLIAEPLLTGAVPVPEEGSVLPDTYDFERGEARGTVLARMQRAMRKTVAELWPRRAPDLAVTTPDEAVVLASIVEKETGKPGERRMVAGLYSNRVKQRMLLQADPTIIYPITKGKPLGRRILQSEIHARNDYNTYTMVGLPKGPITNPGRASIEAVLHPDPTKALYMVADGTGGHVFAATLGEHNANVAKWFALRRVRGEL